MFDFLNVVNGKGNLLHIVAVHALHMPAEGLPLFIQGIEAVDVLHQPVNLHFIIVRKGNQVIQPLAGRQHGRLPHLPFLAFAIANAGVNIGWQPVALRGHGHAYSAAKPLAQGTGGHIDAAGAVHIAMAGQIGAGLVQRVQFLQRKVTAQGQRSVQRRSAVALGQHKAVPFTQIRLSGVNAHGVEV